MKTALAFVVGFFLGGFPAMYLEMHGQQQLAVRAGVAEYVVDPKTGKTTFQFKKL